MEKADPHNGTAPLPPDQAGVFGRARVLIIDDEEPNVRLLERILKRAGFQHYIGTTDPRQAAAIFQEFQPDLVLTDWLMPHLDGLGVIRQLRELTGSDDYLPIVVLTADATLRTKQSALSVGATDFLTKPFDNLEVLLRMQNLLQARFSHLIIQRHNASLENEVRKRTLELENALAELKAAQAQVIQQERLAALGTMAGGIAHDFNNALSIIMGFTEMLLHKLPRGLTQEVAGEPLATILTAAEDAAKIVHRLREFYRPEAINEIRLPVQLNSLVEQAVSLTQPKWRTQSIAAGREIQVSVDTADIPDIAGDAAELREVLTNMIFNAVDAMPQGGTITLRTRFENGFGVLQIGDTGTGMIEEVRQRCLEPFFTTKGARGTGLGLAMVFGIIHRHGGTIGIESEPGKGTLFTLRLPAAELPTEALAEVAYTLQRPLHILVVDDQPILCELIGSYLQSDMHTVEMAHSGTQGLEAFYAREFDLVITDRIMAALNGEQLADAIKSMKPSTPVILLTGFEEDPNMARELSPAVDRVLGKPISRTDLRGAIASVMSGRSGMINGCIS